MDPFIIAGDPQVIVNGRDIGARDVQIRGLNTIVSDLVPRGTAYIFDPSAFKLPDFEFSVSKAFEANDPFLDAFKYRTELRYSIGLGGTITETERDPLERGVEHTLRGVLRQMCAVFGYEWRKAIERPRTFTRSRRSTAVFTGLVA